MKYGVSPAFYVSRWGDQFTIDNILESLDEVSGLGFDSVQLEIFHRARLDEWTVENCLRLKEKLDRLDLRVSLFVAHFLLDIFSDEESMAPGWGAGEFEKVAEIVSAHGFCSNVAVPMAPCRGEMTSDVVELFDGKIKELVDIACRKGLSLSFEPMPGSAGEDLSFLNRIPEAGLLMDPGHMLCSGINPAELDSNILKRVAATHLCDNDGVNNLSLIPGSYFREWEKLLTSLLDAGYENSLDCEIICPRDEVKASYTGGRFFLSDKCIQNNTFIIR